MTIQELLKQAADYLTQNNIDEPQSNAEFLLAHVLNTHRTSVLVNGAKEVSEQDQETFNTLLDRKAQGEPLAYITGTQDFCGHTFIVDSDVLVPRPETEELVQECIERLNKPQRILDMCTGSGCIAISLGLKFRNTEVIGSDNSMPALLTAKKNGENLRAENVQFIYGDLFENIYGTFDLIVTNPPYIPSAVIPTLSVEVGYEPVSALDGGENGLDIVEQIILYSQDFLESGGLFAIEYGKGQEQDIVKIFDKNIWQTPEIKKDIFGINRFIFATKK
ncbi:release factor glutamine methyltransferase [Elusimicrobium posterum]|uniref:peptide chain release factor N(5)-glutamine methyltransferase n=1 Tax=Elusimicrobium posterum TaxID=3116653 RepID=UPI003C77A241